MKKALLVLIKLGTNSYLEEIGEIGYLGKASCCKKGYFGKTYHVKVKVKKKHHGVGKILLARDSWWRAVLY